MEEISKGFLRAMTANGFVLGLVGSAAVLVGVMLGVKTSSFVKRAATADGQVVRLNAGGSHPEISFTAASGEVVSYPQGGWISGFKTGDHVKVLYLADAPSSRPCISDWKALWFLPLLFTGLGLLVALVGFSSK